MHGSESVRKAVHFISREERNVQERRAAHFRSSSAREVYSFLSSSMSAVSSDGEIVLFRYERMASVFFGGSAPGMALVGTIESFFQHLRDRVYR